MSLLLAAVLLYLALRGIDWARVWSLIGEAHWPYVAGGAAISSLTYFLRSLRWRVLLNSEGSFGVGRVFWANMAGYLGNNFLPARAGEVIRSVLIGRGSDVGKTFALTTALGERLMDAIALVLLGSLALLGVEHRPAWMGPVLYTIAATAAAGGIAVAILPRAEGLLRRLLRLVVLPGRVRRFLFSASEQVMLGLRAFHDWRTVEQFRRFHAGDLGRRCGGDDRQRARLRYGSERSA